MRRRAPIVAGVGAVVLAVLAVLFLVVPKMNQVRDTKEQLVQAQVQEDSLNAELKSLQEAQANAPQTEEEIAKLASEVPPTADLRGLIRLLQDARDASAIDFFSFSPGTPTLDTSGRFSIIPTTITVTGSYYSLQEFLFRLETLPRAAKVTAVSISPGATTGTTTTTGTFGLSMNLTVEFYTTDTSAGPGSVPGPSTGGAVPTPGA